MRIYFEHITFDNVTFAMSLELCAHIPEVVYHECQIKIDEEFKMSTSPKYNIKKLDLYMSLRQNDEEYLNSNTFAKFLRAIEDTKLPESLQEIHTIDDNGYYPAKSLETMLSLYGYSFRITADQEQPDWEK